MKVEVVTTELTQDTPSGTVFVHQGTFLYVVLPRDPTLESNAISVLRLGAESLERKFKLPDPSTRIVQKLIAEV